MKLIILTQGMSTMVDDEDYGNLQQHKWYSSARSRQSYAVRNFERKRLYMHHAISGPGRTDHIDGNGLNNQKSNLRKCTASQNAANMRTRSKYGYKGVTRQKHLYKAQITVLGKRISIGYAQTAIEAAKMYDKKAIELFGSFALVNFPETEQ